LLHHARPILLNLGQPRRLEITPWADRVQAIDAEYAGSWELPVIGAVPSPTVVLIRPDGYVAWAGNHDQPGLPDALATGSELPSLRSLAGASAPSCRPHDRMNLGTDFAQRAYGRWRGAR
jgi:hypothetical protein